MGARLPQEYYDRAERLFDDGASQCEVSVTLNVSRQWLRRRFPGRGHTPEQARERIILAQYERRLKEREAKAIGKGSTIRKDFIG